MRIVFAKHSNSEKEYIFEIPVDINGVEVGDAVFVETMYGDAIATATTKSIKIEEDGADEVCKRLGAYFPLKKVKSVCDREFRSYIAREAYDEVIRTMRDVLAKKPEPEKNKEDEFPF